MAFEIQNDVLLAPLTTLGLGGPARYFAVVRSTEDIVEGLAFARRHDLSVFVLGGGSNTIFLDTGYDGLVLHMALRGVDGIPAIAASPGDVRRADSARTAVRVSAGEVWDEFVSRTVSGGLSGIESLSGIPGQAGTVPVQNVGAYGQEVCSTIERVEGIDREGNAVVLAGADCRFAYRSSRFKTGDSLIITAVHFSLPTCGPVEPSYPELKEAFARAREDFHGSAGRPPDRSDDLRLLRECVIRIRRRKSMVVDPNDPDSRSVGSFFTNPVLDEEQYDAFVNRIREMDAALVAPAYPSGEWMKISAAWLVEKAGFARGFSEHGVGVSKAHSLALVNRGGSSADLLALADRIQLAVRERFGIELLREPIVAV